MGFDTETEKEEIVGEENLQSTENGTEDTESMEDGLQGVPSSEPDTEVFSYSVAGESVEEDGEDSSEFVFTAVTGEPDEPEPVGVNVDLTAFLSVLFVLSMIFGILIWHTLSRRWS